MTLFFPTDPQVSPLKADRCPPKPKKVGVSQIACVVAEVYGSRMMATGGSNQPTIPLQQKLLICTLLLLLKEKKAKEVTLGKVKNQEHMHNKVYQLPIDSQLSAD